MLFNTFAYWLFFALVVAVYYAMPPRRRWVLLLVASYGFYGAWSPPYLLLLALSTAVDWQAARGIERAGRSWKRKAWLALSLSANLGLLATYKYADFFLESFEAALSLAGVDVRMPRLGLVLPVGISFYTFQTLSYTIDVYRGQLAAERSFARVALYVSFFPQLVAGPIERASHLLPQLRTGAYAATPDAIASGMRLALFGIFKKVVVADRLALYVDAVYSDPSAHTGPTLLLATYAFAFQIYADFSGYSDVAIGCARALGFDLRPNFDRPYASRSIREF